MLKNQRGFTLLELLIVITVIAILAAIAATAPSSHTDRAKTGKARAQLKSFIEMANNARVIRTDDLGSITGSYWSAGPCVGVGGDLRNIPSSHACYIRWNLSLNNVISASESAGGDLSRDPWGSPFVMDENEGEPSQPSPCTARDNIRSVGPNGIYNDSDDIFIYIPLGGYC